MIVPILYILPALATIVMAFSDKQPRDGVTIDLTTDVDIEPQDFINSVQDVFEQECHNICLKMFPDEGAEQDACMEVCHNDHDDNMNQEAT